MEPISAGMAALSFARRWWKLLALGIVCLLLAIQTVRLGHEKNVSARLRIDLNEVKAELQSISTKKNEQKAETGRNIKEAETIRDKADGVARKIEQAPTAPNCATPPEIMGADV